MIAKFNNPSIHNPVLLREAINFLNIKSNGIYVDCTAGWGGHSDAILVKLNDQGTLICLDQDLMAIGYLQKHFAADTRVKVIKANFNELASVLNELNIKAVDGILLDLGVSSHMFDDANRGFSYHNNGPLDMRMDQSQKLDATKIINQYDRQQLIHMFKVYGEISNPKPVVDAILTHRKSHIINSTNELVEIIKNNIPKIKLFKPKHPARTYFQALRIEVNDEINNLTKVLDLATKYLATKGTLVVIAFHSLEDRIVKHHFIKITTNQIPQEVPLKNFQAPFTLLTKKPILPSVDEINNNRRARSAKLRGVQRN